MTRIPPYLTSLAICAVAFAAAPLFAQNPAAPAPAFEVAAVKQNKTADRSSRINIQPGGRFVTVNVPLRQLITFAYQLQGFQLVGGPDFMTSDRFDITAKAAGDLAPAAPGTAGPVQLMMRALLADRFKLVMHGETRELPIYALVLARSDGRLGPQLSRSTADCEGMMKAAMSRGGPPATPPDGPNGRPACGTRTGGGTMMSGGMPLSQLAASLSQIVQRTVVDKTGLTGNFDLTLTFTPEQTGPGAADVAIDSNGPSIFTALQEQLGLKLDSQRGPVQVLVVDSAQRPVED